MTPFPGQPHAPRFEAAGNAPPSWLKELARLKPTPWTWGQSSRAALSIGIPLFVGLILGEFGNAMWVAMGALSATVGEPVGSYRAKARRIVLTTIIGSLGFYAGHLDVLPWWATVVAMSALAFFAGIISSYGAVFSIGSMQALLMAAITIGVPGLGPYWKMSALLLLGAALYLVFLAIEALVLRRHPQRQAVSSLTQALAALAESRADAAQQAAIPPGDNVQVEAARRTVTQRLSALYALMFDLRSRAVGRSEQADLLAAVLQRGDALFVAIMSETDATLLRATGKKLAEAAQAQLKGLAVARSPSPPADNVLLQAAQAFVAAPDNDDDEASGLRPAATPDAAKAPSSNLIAIALDRLTPGMSAIRSSCRISLCIGLAYAAHWIYHPQHWYWIPLTVTLVMKPDLGPVFVRSMLRSGGTIAGAGIGAIMLDVLPKGPELVLMIACFAGLLPWAAHRSYALQSLMLTPLILVLEDLLAPGPVNVDLADGRIAATVIGSAIVLVFGYFIWPRTRAREFEARFENVKSAISAYLGAIIANSGDMSAGRRQAYGQLADMRDHLQMSLAEPPPANYEATAWFPLIASAERVCDQITVFSASSGTRTPTDGQILHDLRTELEKAPDVHPLLQAERFRTATPEVASFVRGVEDELAYIARLHNTVDAPMVAGPALH